ncbi:hypothetical protein DFAR_1830017 [Desulfarculales bacterium]
MVISVEAGLGLDTAIKRVAEEVRINAPLLDSELTIVSLEQSAGMPRATTLKNLAVRCGMNVGCAPYACISIWRTPNAGKRWRRKRLRYRRSF